MAAQVGGVVWGVGIMDNSSASGVLTIFKKKYKMILDEGLVERDSCLVEKVVREFLFEIGKWGDESAMLGAVYILLTAGVDCRKFWHKRFDISDILINQLSDERLSGWFVNGWLVSEREESLVKLCEGLYGIEWWKFFEKKYGIEWCLTCNCRVLREAFLSSLRRNT